MIRTLVMLVLVISTLFVHIFGGSSQIGTLFFLVIFAVSAKFSGFIGSILIGFAGAPGTLIAMCHNHSAPWSRTYRSRRLSGFLLCAMGQGIFVIIFAALTIGFVKYTVSQPNTCSWILWIAGFLVATSPTYSALQQSVWEEKNNPEMVRGNILHLALPLSCRNVCFSFHCCHLCLAEIHEYPKSF